MLGAVEKKNVKNRDCPAGVASPASLLTLWVRGCNEIYHLEQSLIYPIAILHELFSFVKNIFVSQIIDKSAFADFPAGND